MPDLATCMLFPGDPHFTHPETHPYPCTEPSAAVITFACIHEHVDTPRSCYGCTAEIQRCAGELTCPRCEDGPVPHDCLADMRITWDDGTTPTIVQEVAHA